MNPQNKTLTLLINPFVYLAGGRALLLGLAVIALAALAAFFSHAHFDGVLDTHVGAAAPLWLFFAEGLVDWLCLAAAIFIAGKIISRTAFRFVDVLGTQALARWPTVFISLLVLPGAFHRFSTELPHQLTQLQSGKFELNVADAAVFGIVVLLLIPLTCWTVALMYQSFRVCCNVKGGKAIGAFVVALIAAEILSKACLWPIYQQTLAAQAPIAAPAVAADISSSGARFVDLMAKGNFADAVAGYDDAMSRALPEAKLRAVWQDVQNKMGAFQNRLGTRTTEQAGYQIAFVTCQFEHGTLDTKVVFDSQHRVTGLFFVTPPAAQPAH